MFHRPDNGRIFSPSIIWGRWGRIGLWTLEAPYPIARKVEMEKDVPRRVTALLIVASGA